MANLLPYTIGWAVLATVIVALAVYRKFVAGQEDDFLHVSTLSTNVISHQEEVAKKLDQIDRWGKALTVVAAIYGAILLGSYLWIGWVQSMQKVSQ
jgi:hypothetical protein